MARVKVCTVCEHRNDATEVFCVVDGVSLADVTAVDDAEHPIAPQPAAGTTLEARAPAVHAAIEFSWGRADIVSRLGVGRDAEFSAIAEKLSEFVSRRHAELFFDGNSLFVRHVGQNNPTYLNDKPITTRERVKLNDGDVVGFSKHEQGVVRMRSRQ